MRGGTSYGGLASENGKKKKFVSVKNTIETSPRSNQQKSMPGGASEHDPGLSSQASLARQTRPFTVRRPTLHYD